jgi:hypothetical protein
MLQEICTKYGDTNSNPLELAQGIYWYKADKLFESCKCKSKSERLDSTCDRIQVLLPPLSIGSKKHPDPFNNRSGAAIFGRSRRFDWHWPDVGSPVAKTPPEHDTDEDTNLSDSDPGISMNTSSLGASRHGGSITSRTDPRSNLPSPEVQGRITSSGPVQESGQSWLADDLLYPDGFEPAPRTVGSSIPTNKSSRHVVPNITRAPIPDNKQTTKTLQDSTNRSRLIDSNSRLTTQGEPNIPTVAGPSIEPSRPSR